MTTQTAPLSDTVPQPHGRWPIVGHLPKLAAETRLHWFHELHAQYGDLVRLTALSRSIFLLNNPDHIKHVLQTNNRNYRKSLTYSKLKTLLGNGLLTSEGEFWRQQRRLAQPAFHRRKIANFGRIMVDNTQQMLERWAKLAQVGQPFDVAAEMMRLTLEVVAQTLFSTGLTAEELATVGRVFPPVLHEIAQRTTNPFPLLEKLPLPKNIAYKRNTAAMDKIIKRIIEERRANPDQERDDLLGMYMEAVDDETGASMSNEQLRDEMMTIFLAGHETTATALSWGWMILSQKPEIRARLQQEVDEVLNGRLPTAADFPHLSYTLMFFKEVMRLYPPIPSFGRTPIEDDEIGGHPIPAWSVIGINPYVTHRHPDHWENPDTFDPLRFTPEKEKARHTFAYMPFGGGPRLCIGNNFAYLEAVLTLATVTQKYELNLVNDTPIDPFVTLTMRPKGGVWVRAAPR